MSEESPFAGHTAAPCQKCADQGLSDFPKPCPCRRGWIHCIRSSEHHSETLRRKITLREMLCTACGDRVGHGADPLASKPELLRAEMLKPCEVSGSGVFVVGSDVEVEPEVKADGDGLYAGVKVTKRF